MGGGGGGGGGGVGGGVGRGSFVTNRIEREYYRKWTTD